MNSSSLLLSTTTFFAPPNKNKNTNTNPKFFLPISAMSNKKKNSLKTPKSVLNPKITPRGVSSHSHQLLTSSYKLHCVVSEFQTLAEPIDRVKRLLHYAELSPILDDNESVVRISSNRVSGCTVQAWVDVRMDEFGRMRFMADSDSEIMKGFCSCLVWLLDGALPKEVLELKMDDLAVLNVGGLNGRAATARSRVNTWHNVLINMQTRTQVIVNQSLREEKMYQTVVS